MTRKEQKMKPLFYTMKQVCAMLDLTSDHVRKSYILTGKLKYRRTSGKETGHYRIHHKVFDKFLQKHFMPEDTKA